MKNMFKIYDEPESPNRGGGVCLKYMINRNRQ